MVSHFVTLNDAAASRFFVNGFTKTCRPPKKVQGAVSAHFTKVKKKKEGIVSLRVEREGPVAVRRVRETRETRDAKG